MEYKGYHGSFSFSTEDNMYVGFVLGVSDVLAFHGSTPEEAMQAFHNCIDEYLKMCEALTRTVDSK